MRHWPFAPAIRCFNGYGYGPTTSLLIDAGISGKRVEAGLAVLDRSAKELDGILVTHEHSDHIQGLGVLARRYGIPIYATDGTIQQPLRF